MGIQGGLMRAGGLVHNVEAPRQWDHWEKYRHANRRLRTLREDIGKGMPVEHLRAFPQALNTGMVAGFFVHTWKVSHGES